VERALPTDFQLTPALHALEEEAAAAALVTPTT
jgi:hypothetical protein